MTAVLFLPFSIKEPESIDSSCLQSVRELFAFAETRKFPLLRVQIDLSDKIDFPEHFDEMNGDYIHCSSRSYFQSSPLLSILRKKRITKLIVCGSALDASFFENVQDAVENNFQVFLARDCIPSFPNSPELPDHVEILSNSSFSQRFDHYGPDSRIIYNTITPSEFEVDFNELLSEVSWGKMIQNGSEASRLVAFQGIPSHDEDNDQDWMPLFRKPGDVFPKITPMTPIVAQIHSHLQRVGGGLSFNHVVIQYYPTGQEGVSEHSDKTLDIEQESYIANYSLGATRVFQIRSKVKKAKDCFPVPMRNNSMFLLGPQTNRQFWHSVKADHRPPEEKSIDESLHNGQRISLVFRKIATFISTDQKWMKGQGTGVGNNELAISVTDSEEEKRELYLAFSRENKLSDYSWEEIYEKGFSVLNYRMS
jgi:alkylated DNA repair dioxygenase AlkB